MGIYAAVRIADDSDPETIAGQLRVLAEAMLREPWNFVGSFNSKKRHLW